MKKKNGVVAGIAPRSTRAKDGAAGAEQTTDDEVRQLSSSFVRPRIALAFSFSPTATTATAWPSVPLVNLLALLAWL